MSKNISIQQDGVTKTYNNVSVINTGSPSGSRTDWVPEDETEVVEFTVTQNGTYDLSSYRAYGAFRVNVLVAGGADARITGTIPKFTGVVAGSAPEVTEELITAQPSIGRIIGIDDSDGLLKIASVGDDCTILLEEAQEG